MAYYFFSGEALEEVVREISRYTMAEIEFTDPRGRRHTYRRSFPRRGNRDNV